MAAEDGAGTETGGGFRVGCCLSDHRQRQRIARQTFVPRRRRRLARGCEECAAAGRVREAGAVSGGRDFRRKGHLADGAAAAVCVCGGGTLSARDEGLVEDQIEARRAARTADEGAGTCIALWLAQSAEGRRNPLSIAVGRLALQLENSASVWAELSHSPPSGVQPYHAYGRHWQWEVLGHPADSSAGPGARRDRHRLRSGDGFCRRVLRSKAWRPDPESS